MLFLAPDCLEPKGGPLELDPIVQVVCDESQKSKE